MSATTRLRLGPIVIRVSPLISFLRVAAALAVVCTAILEAFNLLSNHPGTELGAGVIAGTLLAAGAKALHIV